MAVKPFAGVCASVVWALGLTNGQVWAEDQGRQELSRTAIHATAPMEMVVSQATYMPGDTLPRHFHHGLEAAYVIQGARVRIQGRGELELPTGQSVLNLRGIPHGGFEVVGEQPLKLFTVHVVDQGQPLYATE
tara:strand:+ start:185 stop:583 length:399 start_codon:yes stop_codon:yes gene_type:complete